MKASLISKYNVPGPRYTSYPTVPYWDSINFTEQDYLKILQSTFLKSKNEGISLYIHLPFCQQLCTFCACHKHITNRHELEAPYINYVLKEWDMYLSVFGQSPKIKEIHLGGGTPTFFSAFNLERLVKGLLAKSRLSDHYEFSFEAHPNHTTKKQLQCLFDLGFSRLSIGVQDYSLKVQTAINRIQPFEQVKKVHFWAKEIGFTSISHDLVFGLPFQTLPIIKDSILKTKLLLPDRISFYSYAHVPWVKGVGQRGFDDKDLPKANEKRAFYEMAKNTFIEMGYVEIGMDHFSLKSDPLFKAANSKQLHRNFMGYTTNITQLMIGLGMSAIGDSWSAYVQNVKTLKEYQDKIKKNRFPFLKGHILSDEDQVIRKHILNLMCHFKTQWKETSQHFKGIKRSLNMLQEMQKDGLIRINEKELVLNESAIPFVRNICMAFDQYLLKSKPNTPLFSMTI